MPNSFHPTASPKGAVGTVLTALLCTVAVPAPGAMKSINNPQGGAIVYGRVDGQTTESGAMGAMLRSLHTQFGDRPQVGKLFEVRGTQSVAAFFTVNKRTQGKGQQAGLIIVTKVTTDDVEAGMISDDATHLGVSLNAGMKTLFAAWHPFDAARAGGGTAGAVAPLHTFTTTDRTASVEFAGWLEGAELERGRHHRGERAEWRDGQPGVWIPGRGFKQSAGQANLCHGHRAANWIYVGQTQGRGRMDRTHTAQGSSKDILL
jgi:hypothetical protein